MSLSAILSADTSATPTETSTAAPTNSAEPYHDHELAVRITTTESFNFDSATGAIRVMRENKSYLARIEWTSDVYDMAMRYNIMPHIANYYQFVSDVMDVPFAQVETTIESTRINLVDSPIYQKFADKVIKDGKHAGKTQGERLDGLLRRIASVIAQIEAAKIRLRTLRQPAPSPHPETNEGTFGSTHEITKVEASISIMEASLLKKINALSSALSVLNARGSVPVVGPWLVKLPEPIQTITLLNPPMLTSGYVAELTPDSEADDEDEAEAEDEE